MKAFEAVEMLSDGYSVLSVTLAAEVCLALGVKLDPSLVVSWASSTQARQSLFIVPLQEGPGTGVRALELSSSIAEQLGLGRPGEAEGGGKGAQAHKNGQAIARHFRKEGVL